jgi:hypothetical protein
MKSDGGKHDQLSFVCRNGVSVNKEGGYYCRGRQYGVEKKLAVVVCYEYNKQLCRGQPMQRRPTRSLGSYVHELYRLRGTTVSKMMISRFFNHALPTAAGMAAAAAATAVLPPRAAAVATKTLVATAMAGEQTTINNQLKAAASTATETGTMSATTMMMETKATAVAAVAEARCQY